MVLLVLVRSTRTTTTSVNVDGTQDDTAACESSDTINNVLTILHRGGFLLTSLMPVFFQIYVIQLYMFLVQFKLGKLLGI